MQLRNFQSTEFGTNYQTEVALFLEIPKLPSKTVWDKLRVDSMPKMPSICSAVFIELGLVISVGKYLNT